MAAGYQESQNLAQLIIDFCKAQHSRICEEVGRIDKDTPTTQDKVHLLLGTQELARSGGSCKEVHDTLIEACMYHQNGNLLVFFGLMDEKDRAIPTTMQELLKQPWYPALKQLSEDASSSGLSANAFSFDASFQRVISLAHDHRPVATASAATATAGTGETPDLV